MRNADAIARMLTEGKTRSDFTTKPLAAREITSKAWILPNDVLVDLDSWHVRWLERHRHAIRQKFKLTVPEGTEQEVRVWALNHGFTRINYEHNGGRLTAETNQKWWTKKRRDVIWMFVLEHVRRIDSVTINVLDNHARVVRQGHTPFGWMRLDDTEKMDAVPLVESLRRFRVFKKTKDLYRVQERQPDGWREVELADRLLLRDCVFHTSERGRVGAVSGAFASTEDVPVHAWIECASYATGQTDGFTPDGILYYNPYTVRYFMDRASYESGEPVVLSGAAQVSIDKNYLEYSGGRHAKAAASALLKESLLTDDLSLVFSPSQSDVMVSARLRHVYSPLQEDIDKHRVSESVRRIIGKDQ